MFNSPLSVIEAFIKHFFLGDGYEERCEIHMNDKELARDLVILCSLIGIPTCYEERKNSQRIYFQKVDGNPQYPILYDLVPGWVAKSTLLVPGLNLQAIKLAYKDVAPIRVKCVERLKLKQPKFFYDFELKDNHLFIHSLGTITHNCCRLRIDHRELRKRGVDSLVRIL